MFRMKGKYLNFLLIALIIIALFISQNKAFNYYYINNDVRNLFYVNNFDENIKDILAQYSYSKLIGSTVYLVRFYMLINHFFDFIYVTKIVAVVTFLVSVLYAYKLGKSLKDNVYASLLSILFVLYSWTSTSFQGGLSRAFIFPLMLAFLYYFTKKSILGISLSMLLAAMLYPPVFLIFLASYGLFLIDFKEKKLNIDLKKNYLVFLAVLLSFVAIIVPMKLINFGFNEQIQLNDAINMPEFYADGRVHIFLGKIPFTSDALSTIKTIANIYNPGLRKPLLKDGLFILILVFLAFLIFYRSKMLRLPKELYYFILSSFLLQFIAGLVLFRLYFPSRYIVFSLPLFLMLATANALYLMLKTKKSHIAFFFVMILLIILYVPLAQSYLMHCKDEELYEFIATLPKTSVVAGFPADMNCIALYGKRRPFIMSELDIPHHADYYKQIKQRNSEFFTAYYSDNAGQIYQFCRKNNIAYVIANKNHFTKDFLNRHRVYIEPFNSFIKNITSSKKNFYLSNPKNIIFESGNEIVVDCKQYV